MKTLLNDNFAKKKHFSTFLRNWIHVGSHKNEINELDDRNICTFKKVFPENLFYSKSFFYSTVSLILKAKLSYPAAVKKVFNSILPLNNSYLESWRDEKKKLITTNNIPSCPF